MDITSEVNELIARRSRSIAEGTTDFLQVNARLAELAEVHGDIVHELQAAAIVY